MYGSNTVLVLYKFIISLYIYYMKRFRQYIPFQILEINTDKWEYPIHNHNYFEIIFIKEGKGIHTINDIDYSYKKNDIFLISPEQYHIFKIDEHSHFVYLKFTELIFGIEGEVDNKAKWMQKIEYLLFNPNLTHNLIDYNDVDRFNIFNLVEIILNEHRNNDSYNNQIILDSLSLILNLIGRNIYNGNKIEVEGRTVENNRVNDILSYVRLNVYHSDKMKIDNLATTFNMSKNYISVFFKRQTGESLNKYIMNYRMKLSEIRLLKSECTVSEIAYELGFSDESHFNREFKKHHNQTPGQFRK